MIKIRSYSLSLALTLAALFSLTATASAQAQAPVAGTRYDITNYRIEAQIIPDQHLLRAAADITFTPLEATRTVVFELNGSLHVDGIERNAKPLANFVQDAVGVSSIGPSVRVDLGEVLPANQPVTLRFRWSGALVSPEGGPLATKRMAYIGTEGSYLMYASRWFPFHDYAADRATADITVIVPTGMLVAGSSDEPVVGQPIQGNNTRFHFVNKQPALVGNVAAGQFITKSLHFGNYDLQFYVKPGNENRIEPYAELMGKVLEYYTQQYGAPAFGNRLIVAETDNETMDTYAAPGMIFLASKIFESSRSVPEERLEREVAYQWWGQTVGLHSFDDAWLSQGLAEWSAYTYREATLSGGALDATEREELERALTFEQSASIERAPSALDDQSAAYQSIVFYKGAMVFRMLRDLMGQQKFNKLLRNFLDQYRGKNASIADFEHLTSQVAGENLRYFFAQWVEGTGVPEFQVEYQIIRTRAGKFRARGTIKQNFDNLRMPVEVMLRAEGGNQTSVIFIEGKSEDFDFESNGQPVEVVVDPNNKILRMSEELKVAIVARKGIELFQEGEYAEAQQQLEAALKLDRSNSWVYYNLGLLFMAQHNWQLALDNFQGAIDGNHNPAWIEVWARIKRGNAYDAQGNRARAVNEYNKAIQTGDNYDNAQAAAKKFLATPFNPRGEQQQTTALSN